MSLANVASRFHLLLSHFRVLLRINVLVRRDAPNGTTFDADCMTQLILSFSSFHAAFTELCVCGSQSKVADKLCSLNQSVIVLLVALYLSTIL
ncbi:unnamed protein product, partial [Dicrocoelium dendriticum]